MNEVTIQYGTSLAIIIRLVSIFVSAFLSIPALIAAGKVENGLVKLRIQLHMICLTIIIANFISLYFLFEALKVAQKLINSELQIFNAVVMLVLSLIVYRILTQQYNLDNKKLHELLKKMEIKEKSKKEVFE